MFRYLVLGLLRSGEPQHGYSIMKGYEERTGVKMSSGNFYRELIRLTIDGMVRFTENPSDSDPRRAPYVITDEGKAAFDEWLADLDRIRVGPEACDDVVGRAMFFGVADPNTVRGLINHWVEELWYKTKDTERSRDAVLTAEDEVPFPVRSLLLARRLKHMAADIEFLTELGETYEQWISTRGEAGGVVSRGNSSSFEPKLSLAPRRPRR